MLVIFVFLIHLIVWNQFFWGEQELVELKWVLLSIFFVYFLEFFINAKKQSFLLYLITTLVGNHTWMYLFTPFLVSYNWWTHESIGTKFGQIKLCCKEEKFLTLHLHMNSNLTPISGFHWQFSKNTILVLHTQYDKNRCCVAWTP